MDGARAAFLRVGSTASAGLLGGTVAPARQGVLGQWSGLPGDHAGYSLAGDVDGDGIPDLCVGAWGVDASGPGNPSHGRVEMIRGA